LIVQFVNMFIVLVIQEPYKLYISWF
jgi:hypothetical protein